VSDYYGTKGRHQNFDGTEGIYSTLKDHLNLLTDQNSIKKEPNRQDDEVDVKGS